MVFLWALLTAVLGALAVRYRGSHPPQGGLEGFDTLPLSAKLDRIKSPPFTGPRAGALDLREKASQQWDAGKDKDCARTALQAYDAFAALGERGGMAWALAQHADAVDRQGRTLEADQERERSAAMFQEALRSAEDSADGFERLAYDYDSVLYGLWGGAMRRGALGRARGLAEERVRIAESMGQTWLQAYAHEDLARTLKASGRFDEAAREEVLADHLHGMNIAPRGLRRDPNRAKAARDAFEYREEGRLKTRQVEAP
jgi:tetratricopeptide (TPR) repeat protein